MHLLLFSTRTLLVGRSHADAGRELEAFTGATHGRLISHLLQQLPSILSEVPIPIISGRTTKPVHVA
jgi:hypothetical protein